MNYPAASSGVSIENNFYSLAASGGEFNPLRLKGRRAPFRCTQRPVKQYHPYRRTHGADFSMKPAHSPANTAEYYKTENRHGNTDVDMGTRALTWERGRPAGELCYDMYKASKYVEMLFRCGCLWTMLVVICGIFSLSWLSSRARRPRSHVYTGVPMSAPAFPCLRRCSMSAPAVPCLRPRSHVYAGVPMSAPAVPCLRRRSHVCAGASMSAPAVPCLEAA